MEPSQQARFDGLHAKLVVTLKARGMSPKTVDSYSRAVHKLADRFECCPDTLGVDELTLYFAELTDSYSWSTLKVERNGIMFFRKHVLHRHWDWVNLVKPPQVKRLPEVMSVDETRRVLDAVEKLRYRACLFTIYSMGLRLGEGITLAAADIASPPGRPPWLCPKCGTPMTVFAFQPPGRYPIRIRCNPIRIRGSPQAAHDVPLPQPCDIPVKSGATAIGAGSAPAHPETPAKRPEKGPNARGARNSLSNRPVRACSRGP